MVCWVEKVTFEFAWNVSRLYLFNHFDLFCCAQSGFSVSNCSLFHLRTMWARRPSTRLLVRAAWNVSKLSWLGEQKLSKSCHQICLLTILILSAFLFHLCKGSSPNSFVAFKQTCKFTWDANVMLKKPEFGVAINMKIYMLIFFTLF